MKLDENIGNLFISLGIFKNIHPNIISIIGIYLNVLILRSILLNKSKHILYILILLRCLSDILDGMVARKYNKKSKLGGWLDTIQDLLLGTFIIPFILMYKYTKNKIVSFLISFLLTIILLYVYYINDISDHDNINNDKVTLIRDNSILLFILGIVLNYKFNLFNIHEKSK